MSFGTQALFKWKGKSCPSNDGHSCWLGHGDILVMDGQCQEEFRHCTDPVTFRWIKQHVVSCSFLRTGVACCLPTCARGFSFSGTEVVEKRSCFFFCLFGFSLVPRASWGCWLCESSPLCVQGLGFKDVPPTGHALTAEVGGDIIFATPGEFAGQHKKLPV